MYAGSSTKEYAQFRRLWDDSGGLTRAHNINNIHDVDKNNAYDAGFFFGNGGRFDDISRSGRGSSGTSCGSSSSSSSRTSSSSSSRSGGIGSGSVSRSGGGGGASSTPSSSLPPPPPPSPPPPLPADNVARQQHAHSRHSEVRIGNVSRHGLATVVGVGVGVASGGITAAEARNTWEEAMRSEWSSPSDKISGAAKPPAAGRCTTGAAAGAAASTIEAAAVEAGGVFEGRLCEGMEVGRGPENVIGAGAREGAVGVRFSGGGSGGVRAAEMGKGVAQWGRVDLLSVLYPPPTPPSLGSGEPNYGGWGLRVGRFRKGFGMGGGGVGGLLRVPFLSLSLP